jgi:acyl-CoA thioesterase
MAMTDDLKSIAHHFANDGYAAANGMQLMELRPGYARTTLAVEARHMNNMGLVHGGAIFTLAAFAFGAASKTAGKAAVGINTNMSFLRPVRSGVLFADATEISRSRKLSVCEVRVTNDKGELIALFQGTAYIKEESFPPM